MGIWFGAFIALAAVFAASAARANHIAGATYDGTHSGGGTVQLTVSPDGSAVTAFRFTNLEGDNCTFTSGSITGTIPIVNHSFSSNGSTHSLSGSFSAIQTVTGTFRATLSFIPCTSQTVSWTATTTSPPVADLSVTVTASPEPVQAGDSLTYTATIANAGPSDVAGVTYTQTLPAGVTLASATSNHGSCGSSAGGVTCNLGILASGTSATATVTVTPTQAGQITSAVSVTGNGQDPNPGNNAANVPSTVLAPCIVPNVKGKSLAAAKAAIAGAACTTGKVTRAYAKKVKKGRVISQRPAPRTRLPNLSKVDLVVSRGPKPKRR